MSVTTAFKRLMNLPGVTVADVVFNPVAVVVTVASPSRVGRSVVPLALCPAIYGPS